MSNSIEQAKSQRALKNLIEKLKRASSSVKTARTKVLTARAEYRTGQRTGKTDTDKIESTIADLAYPHQMSEDLTSVISDFGSVLSSAARTSLMKAIGAAKGFATSLQKIERGKHDNLDSAAVQITSLQEATADAAEQLASDMKTIEADFAKKQKAYEKVLRARKKEYNALRSESKESIKNAADRVAQAGDLVEALHKLRQGKVEDGDAHTREKAIVKLRKDIIAATALRPQLAKTLAGVQRHYNKMKKELSTKFADEYEPGGYDSKGNALISELEQDRDDFRSLVSRQAVALRNLEGTLSTTVDFLEYAPDKLAELEKRG